MAPHVVSTPHVDVHRYCHAHAQNGGGGGGLHLMVASDGMLDVFQPDEIVRSCKVHDMIARVASLNHVDFGVDNKGRPLWDDVTALVMPL